MPVGKLVSSQIDLRLEIYTTGVAAVRHRLYNKWRNVYIAFIQKNIPFVWVFQSSELFDCMLIRMAVFQ